MTRAGVAGWPSPPATIASKSRPRKPAYLWATIRIVMPTRKVTLTQHLDRFVENEVKSGRFSDASEVIREGLRLMERGKLREDASLEWLRGAVREGIEGIDAGYGIHFSSMNELSTYIDETALKCKPPLSHRRRA